MKVFVVDDSLIVCARLITLLTDIKGIEIVGQARNAPDAIQSILTMQPDVVILDIQLPGGSGIDVLTAVRAAGNRSIIVIFTNYPYPQYKKICEETGADYFFDKSNEFENIVSLFETLVDEEEKKSLKSREGSGSRTT
jgi:DNA-binding NarL/FixJ family response regulator